MTDRKFYKWARHKSGKWHRVTPGIGDGWPEGMVGMIKPMCYPYGNAMPFKSDSPATRMSEDTPPNRRKKNLAWYGSLSHLCQHCVIASAAGGYNFG